MPRRLSAASPVPPVELDTRTLDGSAYGVDIASGNTAVVLEDLDASIECTVFPRTLTEHGHKLVDDAIVTVRGRLDKRDEARVAFMVQDLQILEGLDAGQAAPLRLRVPATSLNELKIAQIKKILREHPGDSPVYLHIGQGKVLRLADEFRVDLDRVVGELRMALGHDAVML